MVSPASSSSTFSTFRHHCGQSMLKKLGGKRWQSLHRLIYLIAILGVLHFWWLVKKDITEPLIYAVILASLLGYRVMKWRLKVV
ncbi:MAG: hypothetical protein ABL858_08885 [Candidatus Nitrotoga sp.]